MQPVPLTIGPNWQPNDVRILFISASGTPASGSPDSKNNATLPVSMTPDPPTGFTAAYSMDPGFETRGVYYNYLVAGDTDTSVAFPKPPGWRDFNFATITARGVSPSVAPVAGSLSISHIAGASTATVSSVAFAAAGDMVFCVADVPDPEGLSASWAVSLGVPTGWTPLVATDKSGTTYFAYDANPALEVIGKNYSTSGSTGAVAVPVGQGGSAFFGMYAFLQPASDVSVAVGAA